MRWVLQLVLIPANEKRIPNQFESDRLTNLEVWVGVEWRLRPYTTLQSSQNLIREIEWVPAPREKFLNGEIYKTEIFSTF